MAINVMTMVWEHAPFKGGQLLLLLALADHAHKDGTHVYPGVSTLAQDARMTERQVRRCLKDIEASGIIIKVSNATGKPGWKNEYRIDLEALKKCQGGKNVTPDKDDEAAGHLEQDQRTSAPPYIEEPSFEPSENRHSLAERDEDASPSAEVVQRVATIAKGWTPAIWSAFKALPNIPATVEDDAREAWEKIPWDDRPTTDELVGCVEAYGRDLIRINATRHAAKPQMVQYPENWLRGQRYKAFLDDVRRTAVTSAAKGGGAKSTAGDADTLGAEAIGRLITHGFNRAELDDWFGGATIDYGPPVTILLLADFKLRWITNKLTYMGRLRRAFGDDVIIELAMRSGVA